MQMSRRAVFGGTRAGATPAPRAQGWLRLRTKDWDFFVADEIEAFAVIARHDVLDVEALAVH